MLRDGRVCVGRHEDMCEGRGRGVSSSGGGGGACRRALMAGGALPGNTLPCLAQHQKCVGSNKSALPVCIGCVSTDLLQHNADAEAVSWVAAGVLIAHVNVGDVQLQVAHHGVNQSAQPANSATTTAVGRSATATTAVSGCAILDGDLLRSSTSTNICVAAGRRLHVVGVCRSRNKRKRYRYNTMRMKKREG